MIDPAGIPRRRFHRTVFFAAALYNVVWGLNAALRPEWTFYSPNMAPLRYPEVFACLGMVIGLYGLLYAEVARRPEHGFAIAAVGLTGKILGPAAWLWLCLQGKWPLDSGTMILTNDVIWWLPFALYLRDSWPSYRASFSSSG